MAANTLLEAVSDRSSRLLDHPVMVALVAVVITSWRSPQENRMSTVSSGDYYGG